MNECKGIVRTRVALKVKIINETSHWHFRTVDLSDAGIFIAAQDDVLQMDELVQVQVQDLPFEAPVRVMRVVQSTPEGYGLIFIPDASEEAGDPVV